MEQIVTRNTRLVRNKKGFTLVEMLIMLAVVGVIAGILFGVVGNTYSDSATKGNAIQVADGLRQISEGMQNYQAQNTTKATLTTVVSGGFITTLPVVPAVIGNAWTLDSTTAAPATLLTLTIPDAQVDVCKKINEMYAGATSGAAPAATPSTSKDLQCAGAAGAYIAQKIVYSK